MINNVVKIQDLVKRNDVLNLIKYYEAGYNFQPVLEKVGNFIPNSKISPLLNLLLKKISKNEGIYYD